MKKYELPLVMTVVFILLSYVIDLSLIQGVMMAAFSGAVYFTGRRIKIE